MDPALKFGNQKFVFRSQTDFWSIPQCAALLSNPEFKGFFIDREGYLTARMVPENGPERFDPFTQILNARPTFDPTVMPTLPLVEDYDD